MKLRGLLEKSKYTVLNGTADINISGIAHDSRNIKEGNVFVAISGFEQDGHRYIYQAINNGAKAVVLEEESIMDTIEPSKLDDVTVIRVENSRVTLAYIASRFYDEPSSEFRLVGVTGTNGKTSTVFLINNILEYLGKKTGVIGTIVNKIGKKVVEAERTTPDALQLKRLFQEMADENISDVIMEVSSHALDLHRVDYSRFDIGIFTNLTHEHLDYHKTMENYCEAKAKLFDMVKTGIINIDDEYAKYMLNRKCNTITYSTKDSKADFYAKDIKSTINGTEYTLVYKLTEYNIKIQTPGLFSVYNSLAAIAALTTMNVSMEKIIEGLEKNSQIKGRFQSIVSSKGYTAIVDYAHAPDGLLNVLKSIKEFATAKIITVFGCGGDRDRTKRPEMGKIAGDYSDYSIITSDNPRTEDPETIIDEIEFGMKESNGKYERITDRKKAIEEALSKASKDDIVLVAGKGHEDYQIIGKEKHHFDDAEIIINYMDGEK